MATKYPAWSLGDRLRKAREQAGLKQEEMADILGVSPATISNWEKGQRHARGGEIEMVRRWAHETDVSWEWILGIIPDKTMQAVNPVVGQLDLVDAKAELKAVLDALP